MSAQPTPSKVKQTSTNLSWRTLPRAGLLRLSLAALCLTALCLTGFNKDLEAQNQHKRSNLEKSQHGRVNRVSPNSNSIKGSIDLNATETIAENSIKSDPASRARISAQVYPVPALETVITQKNKDGSYQLIQTPSFKNTFLEHRAAKNQNGDFVFFTLDEKLQAAAEKIVRGNNAPHVALIAMDPRTGKVLALAEKSSTISDLTLHAGFPAASLFKVVTTAAAIDSGKVANNDLVKFRGGTYELSQWNYLPNNKTDKRSMSIGEALGKSCNPVFGRVALNSLSASMLEKYGRSFGFRSKIPFELDTPASNMDIPAGGYALSRTAAGFGDVNISPLHAVTLMAGLANNGLANRPVIIDKIISPSGEVKYRSEQQSWLRLVPAATAARLMNLMVNTTTIGTSRKEFIINKKSVLGNVRVAGKTGTLKGKNPVGLNNWFIGAPVDNPTIAVAAIVVDPGGISTKASRMGRMLIQESLKKS